MNANSASRVDRVFPTIAAELARLVAIPSVSAPGWDPLGLRRSADATRRLLEGIGLPEVELVEVDGAPPAVYGRRPAGPDAVRVLLYAHHDVQPPGPADDWSRSPFDPVERDGRLYGRGAADNKAGIAIHAAALAALPASAAVDITVLIEGEEEVGSPHIHNLLDRLPGVPAADVVISTDAALPAVGQPGLTVSLRGLVDCVVELRTLPAALHSGVFGGAVPDALSAMARLLATLHDDAGSVAIDDAPRRNPSAAGARPVDVAAVAGLAERLRGGPTRWTDQELARRLWHGEAVAILGLDAPTVADAANQLVPAARAKVSFRIRPDEDPAQAQVRLCQHLTRRAPWGAEVRVMPGESVPGVTVDVGHPVFGHARSALREAWGADAVLVGSGGCVPAMGALAERFPSVPVIMFGAADPTACTHAPDESVDLTAVRRAALAECLLLERLGDAGRRGVVAEEVGRQGHPAPG